MKCNYLHTSMRVPPLLVKRKLSGFTLVEVAIALGIVSFALLALVGLLSSGLRSVGESATETALAVIVRQVRAELNQAEFHDLSLDPWYFNEAGLRLPRGEPSSERFFKLEFSEANPEVAGQTVGFERSAKIVSLSVSYPDFAPPAARSTDTFSMLVARQNSQSL